MFYYFYKITNNINGKYYYGVHSTNDLNDNYMGSGVHLHHAYNKYGIENFTKTILQFFDNAELMYKHEEKVVTIDVVNDPMCYNIRLGGRGGTKGLKLSEETKQKLSDSHKGKKLSEEHKQSISESNKGRHSQLKGRKRPNISKALKGKTPWNKGKHSTDETRKKISEAKKGKPTSKKGKKYGKMSDEHKQNISKSLIGKSKSDEHKQHIREAKYGTHLSEETKQKISNSHKGKRWKNINGKRFYY